MFIQTDTHTHTRKHTGWRAKYFIDVSLDFEIGGVALYSPPESCMRRMLLDFVCL